MSLDQHIKSDPTIAFLAREWVKRNRPRFAKDACRVSAAINVFAMLAELVIVERVDYFAYAPAHVVLVMISLVNLGLLRVVKPHSRLEQRVATWCLASPAIGLLAAYSYFFLLRQPQYVVTLATSYAAVAFFGALYLHRFWREQHLQGVGNLACLALLAYLLPEQRMVLATLLSLQFLASFTMHLFRRDFFGAAYERFKGYQALLPVRVATNLVVAPGEALDDTFAPAARYTICLCSDWRNFQGLASAWTPTRLAEAIGSYYEIVCERLAMHLPDDRYFFDWTADELFVVFFADPGQEADLMDNVMTFVYELGTSIHERSVKEFGFDFRYDIGLAAGEALVGIVGPKMRRKTTVIGQVPGVAKRLESEAKRLRELYAKNERPLVVLDEALGFAARQHGYLDHEGFHDALAQGKDVKDLKCVTWQTPFSAAYRSVS